MEFLRIWEMLVRRRWLIAGTALLILVPIVAVSLFARPVYEARARILVKRVDPTIMLTRLVGMRNAFSEREYKHETEAELVLTRPVLEEFTSALNLQKRSGEAIDSEKLTGPSLVSKILARHHVSAKQYEDADMLEITALSPSPAEAAEMANKLAELYVRNRIDLIKSDFQAARVFIEERSAAVRQQYHEASARHTAYLEKEGLILPKVQAEKLVESATSLESGRNMEMERLGTKLNELLADAARKSADIKEGHPDFRMLQMEIEAVKEQMMREMDLLLAVDASAVDPPGPEEDSSTGAQVSGGDSTALRKQSDFYRGRAREAAMRLSENAKLELEVTAATTVYQYLREQQMRIGMAETLALADVEVVEPAVEPEKAEFPRKGLGIVFGLFLACFGGLTLALCAEYVDDTIRTPERLACLDGVPVVGWVPKSRALSGCRTIARQARTSSVSGAYDRIAEPIRRLLSGVESKVLFVTSSLPGEGKTSVASNAAVLFARQGMKVVLVDGNWRRPAVHRFWGISEEKGLADVTAGSLRVEEALVSSGVDNLEILPCRIGADSGRQVNPSKLKGVLELLKQTHDLVIVDTAPALVAIDPVDPAAGNDGVLLVVSASDPNLDTVRECVDALKSAGFRIVGSVLNRFKIQPFDLRRRDHRSTGRYCRQG